MKTAKLTNPSQSQSTNSLSQRLLAMKDAEIDAIIESSTFFQEKDDQAIEAFKSIKNLHLLGT
ncbi:hypothetical protein [Dyadobacter sp. MSC1_007]|jgi:hypothetical protein|uniref:hypothetical protein n=1 Tax=Dyadobacter sp. MSC1_007 TaxID=2909264 RepID=UPI002030056C|nr:hypothetical protein [Dyadobacter sp. MSC1_007]